MEFLLINHPFHRPICDQGGECELQDLSVGYGNDISRYHEGKRSVVDEDLGPLIATEMTRCIQCTRCVRFGTEIAGMRELGVTNRGENLEISTYVEKTMRSELSGNVIDLCPVGALTSKPFRFTARPWELRQHVSIAPHDCIGSNIFVHTRGYEYNDYRLVMRVVPRENEKINETWISDRDRFSYQAVQSSDRLLTPKIKRESSWVEVDWTTALDYIAEKWQKIIAKEGADQIAALASPNSTVEEFYLLQKLLRKLGSNNLDHRIRQLDFKQQDNYPSHPQLGLALPDIEQLDKIFLIGSNTRREQPLANHRIRKASLRGAEVICVNPIDYDFNFDLTKKIITPSCDIPRTLGGILKAVSLELDAEVSPFLSEITPTREELTHAKLLLKKGKGVLLLGLHALQHPKAALIRALAEQIAFLCHFSVGELSQGANSAGGWLAGMIPHRGAGGVSLEKPGLHADDILKQKLASVLLLNIEPELDCLNPMSTYQTLLKTDFVIALTPFITETQEQYADVLLPIAPFFETSGTFINATNEWQKFEAVTKPLGEAKPAWKVLRVLGNLLKLDGFNYIKNEQIIEELQSIVEKMPALSSQLAIENIPSDNQNALTCLFEWPMYQDDNFVRRASALQEWSGQEKLVAIRINSTVAAEFNVQAGELISVIHDETILDLPVVIDDRIAGNYVLLPVGIQETAAFGEHMSIIKLLRGRLSNE